MNAPPNEQQAVPPASIAREYAWERLEENRALPVILQGFLELGDDHGAACAIAKLTANVDGAVSTKREIDVASEKARAA
jgi:hypothetical protein